MDYPQQSFKKTTFPSQSFWGGYRGVVHSTTLRAQLSMLKTTGRYDAFKLQWHPSYSDTPTHWPVPNHLFWDSDVAKWIEGAVYFLKSEGQDKEIEGAVDELVQMIRSAQKEDGYLNIHFTVVAPKERWSNLRDLHELYNAGHLIEAAVAHHMYSGNSDLLEPILKYVDLIDKTLGPDPEKLHGYPGHPEIELALLRLYTVTNNPKHLNLAKYFITERGNPTGQDGHHYYDYEARKRGEREHERPEYYPQSRSFWYQQAHKPLIEQQTIRGHSVRAMYLLTALADLHRLDPSPQYYETLTRLWSNMVQKKLYVTGGIGATKQWEGFNIDYFLPQTTDEGGCYAETCASIGLMMLAERMLRFDLNREYADVMELALYNTVLGSMNLKGNEFTYENQLASSPGNPCKRNEWFECACCPPNVTRLFGTIGGYVWSHNVTTGESGTAVEINVHLFTAATLTIPLAGDKELTLTQATEWPWKGTIDFHLSAPKDVQTTIRIRIPCWAENLDITLNEDSNVVTEKGYMALEPSWLNKNPKFTLNIPMKPRFIYSHPFTNQNTVTVARGPIIYCLEDVDNTWVDDHFKATCLDHNSPLSEKLITDEKTTETFVQVTSNGGFKMHTEVHGQDVNVSCKEQLPQLVFIPFYFRGNRGGGGMVRVGLKFSWK